MYSYQMNNLARLTRLTDKKLYLAAFIYDPRHDYVSGKIVGSCSTINCVLLVYSVLPGCGTNSKNILHLIGVSSKSPDRLM